MFGTHHENRVISHIARGFFSKVQKKSFMAANVVGTRFPLEMLVTWNSLSVISLSIDNRREHAN